MKKRDVQIGFSEHFVKWSADEFAASDNSNFLVFELDVITGEKPVDGGSGSGVEIAVFG